MPEISRFFGIIIRRYAEPGAPHHRPHFHAYYQEETAVFAIDSIERIAGSLLRRPTRLVEAWAEIHQEQLLENWVRLQNGQPPLKIDPSTLHDWPMHADTFAEMAARWSDATARSN